MLELVLFVQSSSHNCTLNFKMCNYPHSVFSTLGSEFLDARNYISLTLYCASTGCNIYYEDLISICSINKLIIDEFTKKTQSSNEPSFGI